MVGTTVFFPRQPIFNLGDAVFWTINSLAALFAIPAKPANETVVTSSTAAGVGAFVAAGVKQINYTLQP
jgi:hypothetical protein